MGFASSIIAINTTSIQKSSDVVSQIDVTNIQGVRKHVEEGIKRNAILQPGISTEGVLKAAYDAGQAERQAMRFVALAQQRQRHTAALLSQLRTGINHAKSNLGVKDQIQGMLAELGMAQIDHQMNTGVMQNHYQGHLDSVNGSGSGFNLIG